MKNDPVEKVSLEYYIDHNDKLLSVLGVFVAVVALTTASTNWALNVLAFVSIGGVVLLGYTLLAKIDKNSPSLQLELFRYVLLWGGVAFIIYWVSEFRLLWHFILWIPATVAVFALVVGTSLPLIRRYNFTCNLFGIKFKKKRWYQKLTGGIAVF